MEKKLKNHLLLSILLVTLGQVKAQQGTLDSWLALDADDRPELSRQKFAQVPLNGKKAEKAAQKLLNDKQNGMVAAYACQWKNRVLKYEGLEMPFYYKVWGVEPKDGRSLFLSMHGGGGAPARVNDGQYENQKKLYNATMKDLEGVYMAMRAPTDTWDLWHRPHIDEFLNRLIQLAVIYENVNPNKVYILGYSAGGDGAFQLAPRLADRWAAAAMMAGHPGDASAVNMRNTPFSIHVGEFDAAYDRNKHAKYWGKILDSLQKKDSAGYRHLVRIPKGKGHWMHLEDAEALPWMKKFVRNPIPKKVVWRQDNVLHDRFYWLEVPKTEAKAYAQIIAEYDYGKNEVNIVENYSKRLILNLNDDMLDLNRPVHIKYRGKSIFKGKVKRKIWCIWESLKYKGDPNLVFTARIELIDNRQVLD